MRAKLTVKNWRLKVALVQWMGGILHQWTKPYEYFNCTNPKCRWIFGTTNTAFCDRVAEPVIGQQVGKQQGGSRSEAIRISCDQHLRTRKEEEKKHRATATLPQGGFWSDPFFPWVKGNQKEAIRFGSHFGLLRQGRRPCGVLTVATCFSAGAKP